MQKTRKHLVYSGDDNKSQLTLHLRISFVVSLLMLRQKYSLYTNLLYSLYSYPLYTGNKEIRNLLCFYLSLLSSSSFFFHLSHDYVIFQYVTLSVAFFSISHVCPEEKSCHREEDGNQAGGILCRRQLQIDLFLREEFP